MYLKPWISTRIHVSKSMDGNGHKYKSLDIRVHPCVFTWMYVHGYLWISVRIYVLKSMDGCKHPWISRDMTWTSMNNANFSGRWKPSFCKNNTHPHCSGVDFYPSPWKRFIPKFEKKTKKRTHCIKWNPPLNVPHETYHGTWSNIEGRVSLYDHRYLHGFRE